MTAPIRVDQATDERITHAAALLGVSKKQFVAEAVAAYVEQKAPDLDEGLRQVAEMLIPARLVVGPSALCRAADLIEEAPEPTRRLRELSEA